MPPSAETAHRRLGADDSRRVTLVPYEDAFDRAGGACAVGPVRGVSVCDALEPDVLDALDGLSKVARIPARRTLFREGEAAHSVFNVVRGTLRLYRLLSDGRRQIVAFLSPGDFVGLSMADRHAFSADAIDAVTVRRFARLAFAELVDGRPRLSRRLHAAAGHELTLARDHMVLLGRLSAEEKVSAFLLAMRARAQRSGGGGVTIALPMSRQDIADYLGLTVETVSRAISKLARDRALLVVPDGVRLLDTLMLETLCGD